MFTIIYKAIMGDEEKSDESDAGAEPFGRNVRTPGAHSHDVGPDPRPSVTCRKCGENPAVARSSKCIECGGGR